ncbi:MAG: hypothetical protein ONB15_04215 [candidate division KSB1 bacterium]|nr:hypothetical protein [candidate division KSB1 bacterium]
MTKGLRLLLTVSGLLTVLADAVGQERRTAVEIFLGWGKPPGGDTDYYQLGGYYYPSDVIDHRLMRYYAYTSELQWVGCAQAGITYAFVDRLAGLVYIQVEPARFAAFKTLYHSPEPPRLPGAHRSTSDVEVDGGGYVVSGAVGLRLYPLGRKHRPFCELTAGRRYTHVDIRWDLSVPPEARAWYYRYVRNRSEKGFGAIALGYSLALGDRWTVQGKLQWLPPGWTEYEMLIASLGVGWRL